MGKNIYLYFWQMEKKYLEWKNKKQAKVVSVSSYSRWLASLSKIGKMNPVKQYLAKFWAFKPRTMIS